ncbi:MAG: hypothetical protein FJX76_17670 [Armatimonadetes bacterium]|nr:hypothetical protein [Armatimonadota bacterium]
MSDMTPYHQIAELVQWMRAGHTDDAAVREHLLGLERDIGAWTERANALAPAGDPPPEATDVLEGLRLFRVAIGELTAYLDSRDDTVAERALENARNGVELLLRAKVTIDEEVLGEV